MKQFLSVILRNQFNLFYRFGYSTIPNSSLLEFDGRFSDDVNEKVVELFSKLTPFEYDEEYLILHLENKTGKSKDVKSFSIQDVVAIYPLSNQSKISIESKIDSRIKLCVPISEEVLSRIETVIDTEDRKQAINALWQICDIKEDRKTFISNIGIEHIFKGLEYRKNGIKADKIKDSNYWEYLIAYDRYEYFPNTILGYFYDAGQIFAFSKGMPTFEGCSLYKYLEKLNKTEEPPKIQKIVDSLEAEEQSKGYVSQTITNGIKLYFVAPIYLMLKEEIRKSDDLEQSYLIKYLGELKKFGDSFNYAVILLGAFFGFHKFYDAYYNTLNLRFYKTYNPDDIYKRIIREYIQKKEEVKLTDIVNLIKGKTGEKGGKKLKSKLKDIIEKMGWMEYSKKRQIWYKKKPNDLFSKDQ